MDGFLLSVKAEFIINKTGVHQTGMRISKGKVSASRSYEDKPILQTDFGNAVNGVTPKRQAPRAVQGACARQSIQ